MTAGGITRVPVALPDVPYEVLVGPGLLARAGEFLRAHTAARKVAVVSDSAVAPLYAEGVSASLARAGFEPTAVTVPAGEASKSWAMAGGVLEQLAAARLGRGDVVLALGGGVVGDLAGFCAATYLRGIDYAQAPTTLLAQVDSSVGGKTGVDLSAGKNLAGAFKQPLVVLADTSALSTLPDTEWQSGLAEVAKVAMLAGPERVAALTAAAAELRSRAAEAVRDAVLFAVGHKASVVIADEREAGLRESLNYGHTLAHAIEQVAGYGAVPHGIAVAEGMRFAARIAERVLSAPPSTAAAQAGLLDLLGIERVRVPGDSDALLGAMHADKKARDGVVRFALVPEPGVFLATPVGDEVIAEELGAWLASQTERG